MATYEVTYTAFKHQSIEADSEEEALEKASSQDGSWEVDGERVNGPY